MLLKKSKKVQVKKRQEKENKACLLFQHSTHRFHFTAPTYTFDQSYCSDKSPQADEGFRLVWKQASHLSEYVLGFEATENQKNIYMCTYTHIHCMSEKTSMFYKLYKVNLVIIQSSRNIKNKKKKLSAGFILRTQSSVLI